MPIDELFLKPWFSLRTLSSFLGGDSQQSSPECNFHSCGSNVHPSDYTLLLLTPTCSTPPLTEAGRAPTQRNAVLHQRGTWISSFLCKLSSLNSWKGELHGATSLTRAFYKHVKKSSSFLLWLKCQGWKSAWLGDRHLLRKIRLGNGWGTSSCLSGRLAI